MSIGSESVKLWRRNTKERLLKAFGNKCAICGFNKSYALDFHHLNPDEKEFTFGHARGNIIGWDKLVIEVRKCICLCANCHRGHHAGELEIPEDAPRFDKNYTTYDRLFKKKQMDKCPVCNELKEKFKKTCSYECAGQLKYKLGIQWHKFDLKKMLNDFGSYEKVGDEIGVTGASVVKRMKKLGIYNRKK